jgi:hypothetical protein
MQQAPMEAALSSVVILWESNGLFINFRSLPCKEMAGVHLKGICSESERGHPGMIGPIQSATRQLCQDQDHLVH